ncbi:hypothetical protein [Opitutus sp. ER46]|uniref:sodium:solute symporter family transporter n=1 Tax=Opitutus sp. ER46 TaxID=2161864 RepID=UPI000D322306|nr:hypothetical protein [Opitutus sp. ER46]PTX98531.1 hypothetical protein DB354_04510 [Opitutus sp. ER46]
MVSIDYVVIGAAVMLLLVAGFFSARRAGRNSSEFILGGRTLPWWLGGAAMVAGATSCDSPLHQSAKIRREGLGGAWFYWSQVLAVVWHSLVFSRLWRRTGVNTVVEFYHIRYHGRGGQLGRIWSMVFATLLGSTISLALGLLAMIKICRVLLDLQQPVPLFGMQVSPELLIVTGALALALSYSVTSGLRGVVAGDLVEFLIVILCSYVLMFFVLREVGYGSGLREAFAAEGRARLLSIAPQTGISLLVFFLIQPLASVAGDNGLNQRFLAIKDERQAVFSGLWRMVTHYFVRAWPWYVCGLASLVLLADVSLPSELAYPHLIKTYMPAGWRGLMFAGFLVAFMSCVGNALHNAGVVFVNDFYRPFVVKDASERHYVWAIRATMLVTAIVGTWIALASDQILRLLQIAITIVGASGLVMLLRWFWWRVNGWADLAAQVLALPVTLLFTSGPGGVWIQRAGAALGAHTADDTYGLTFIATLVTTTALWLVVMALTRPEPFATLEAFYRRVRPYGWWGPVARRCPDVTIQDRFARDLVRYVAGLVVAGALLFGFGAMLLGSPWLGTSLCAGATIPALWLIKSIEREYRTPTVTPTPTPADSTPLS